MTPPVGYIAYIDEAGDTGLKQIRTKGLSPDNRVTCLVVVG